MRGPAQSRRWRKLLAGAGSSGMRTRFQLAVALYDAAHGAPGDVGRFIRSAPPVQRVRLERLREVLPLPIPDAPEFLARRAEWLERGTVSPANLDAAVAEGWTVLIVQALNYQYSGHSKGSPVPTGPPTAAQDSSMRVVREAAAYFARGSGQEFAVPDWTEVVAARDVTYGGEEVSRALPLTLGGVLPGLPARGIAASVRALDLADERVAGWLSDPTLVLLPKAEWPEEVPRAAIQTSTKPEWYRIAAKLVELGLAVPIADERIFKVGNRKVLAGAFGVAKSGTPTPGHSVVQRLIINMVPANSYQRTMRDDIGTLSASPSWVAVPLPEGHVLLWSSDDQASAFYCYELPEAWQPYMTLAQAVPNELIGVSGPGKTHIALRVIPMGWINAVTVFQHCHRRLGFGLKPLAAGFPPEVEWRKDRPLPFKSRQLEQAWIQYYIDDWDHGEIVPEGLVNELVGTMSAVQGEQRAAYARSGIGIAENKAKYRELILERMGAGVDGVTGRVGVTTEKLHLLLALIMWAMGQREVTVKAMLVVLGRCVRAAEFRRPFMGFLNDCWAAGQWAYPRAVPTHMCGELLLFCMALPLAFTDLRAKIDTCVIATDASEQAGGICYSAGLTERGMLAASGKGALCEDAQQVPFKAPQTVRWRPRVVLVELFAGAGASAVAAARLPMEVVAHISSEIDPAARRLVRRRWPGVIELGNVETIDCERFGRILEGFKRDADWVIITAGSPCQDLSTLNVVGQGLEGERSKLFQKVPDLIEAAERVFVKCVTWFVENVFSMGLEARAQFSSALQVIPLLLDAKDFTRVRRPRLFWCSWPAAKYLPPGAVVTEKGEGLSRYLKVEVTVQRAEAKLWPLAGWQLLDPEVDLPCFTRPIRRRHPPLRPVGLERATAEAQARWVNDGYRYQVNNYEVGAMLWDSAQAQCRLPVAEERGVLMGFDHRYFEAAVKDSVAPEERDIIMESLIGNTFCVQCVTYLLGSWLARVGALSAAVPAELCLDVGEREGNWNIDADFTVTGFRHPTAERSLIIEFLRIADRGGTDVRLDCNAPYRARAWPRSALRTSLWAWRIAKSFQWQRPAHISELELEAAVAGARWRYRDVAKHRCRYLHLLDAQAVAAVCTKCRTSAWRLQPGIRRLNALALATGSYPMYGYCDTDDMPADVPSRWAGARGSQGEESGSQGGGTQGSSSRPAAARGDGDAADAAQVSGGGEQRVRLVAGAAARGADTRPGGHGPRGLH